jgi:kynurenine formamidase
LIAVGRHGAQTDRYFAAAGERRGRRSAGLRLGDRVPHPPADRVGREIGYCHIEKLHNLEALPAKGFTLSCFPVKVRGGSAGWTRAVAIIDA